MLKKSVATPRDYLAIEAARQAHLRFEPRESLRSRSTRMLECKPHPQPHAGAPPESLASQSPTASLSWIVQRATRFCAAALRTSLSGNWATQAAAASGDVCAQRWTIATAVRSCSGPGSTAVAARPAAVAGSCLAEARATAARRRWRSLESVRLAGPGHCRGRIGGGPLAGGVNKHLIPVRRGRQCGRDG